MLNKEKNNNNKAQCYKRVNFLEAKWFNYNRKKEKEVAIKYTNKSISCILPFCLYKKKVLITFIFIKKCWVSIHGS